MSGFSYPEWIGEFYAKGTKRDAMLVEYAKFFDAVEINTTFRRSPEPSTVDRWRDAVGESFRFTLKANQRITHWRRLVDATDFVSDFMTLAGRMGAKLGPVLFQVPPTMTFDADVVGTFGSSLPPGYSYAFEPRDPSFMTPGAVDLLRAHGIALCLNDDLFDPSSYVPTARVAYFRFHRESYMPGDLQTRAELLRRFAEEGLDVYAFFQHEDNPESVRPALRMKELVA